MSQQYHFVVMYDFDSKKFSVDVDTTIAKFDQDLLFDTETQEWQRVGSVDYYGNYQVIEDQLANALAKIGEQS